MGRSPDGVRLQRGMYQSLLLPAALSATTRMAERKEVLPPVLRRVYEPATGV
ncbi:hypothetical protein D3C87_1828920 [compost metagenome]